jgi:hypothetical protein
MGMNKIERMLRYLTSIIFQIGFATALLTQNPHSPALKIDCASCHSPEGWAIASKNWNNGTLVNPNSENPFSHSQTDFPLTGRHGTIDCRDCHETLVFQNAQPSCISCHTDLHQMTVGDDCARCHSTQHWLVDNITQLHVDNGFPLLGNHAIADCRDCHTSETDLRFDRIGNECFECHLDEYQATTSPDHTAAGFSTDCIICHDVAGTGWLWTAGGANHLFFPLTGGHQINDCTQCHTNGNFTNTPTDCFACHQDDYAATANPNHQSAGFPTDCSLCHTTDPGWPAGNFTQHDDAYFPIFSGKHKGEWNQCSECHTTPGNFKAFSCIDCHEHNDPNDLAKEHDEVSGYQYVSQACFECHPRGEE